MAQYFGTGVRDMNKDSTGRQYKGPVPGSCVREGTVWWDS